jgi:methionine synthase II (cobalamin-independent)
MASQPLKNTAAEDFSPRGLATLIGSLPVADHRQGWELINRYTPAIPLWPQLPSNPKEGMLVQFMEGMVGLVEGERTYLDTGGDFDDLLLPFFEDFLAVAEDHAALMASRFAISRERAGGLYLLKDEANSSGQAVAVKGQITGPFTVLTGLQDQDQRLSYYNPSLREMVVQGLAMKSAWQVRFLKETGLPVLIFIDEPALAGLGSSAFITISQDDIAHDQSQVVDAIHGAGGLAGVHVCANTEWSLLLTSNIDIVSFDAYTFFDRFITCRDQIHSYLDRGGIIAWGIVPTSENDQIEAETGESLVARWEEQAAQLCTEQWTIPAILEQSLITPSCGTGSLSPDLAEKVLALTSEVSATLRHKYLA